MAQFLRVGTSGYAYKEWKGSFYPSDLPATRMLSYYGAQFSTVEINNTFYKNPNPEVLRRWADQTPEDFLFVLKGGQYVTHRARLKDVQGSVQRFFEAASALGKKRGPVFFQLPPNFKCDVLLLDDFLGTIPAQDAIAVEFRHASWFDDRVYETLQRHNAALCVAESDDMCVPRVATADWGYLRLRRTHYSAGDLKRWHTWAQDQTWRTAYVFFKHEDGGQGPQFARQLLEMGSSRP